MDSRGISFPEVSCNDYIKSNITKFEGLTAGVVYSILVCLCALNYQMLPREDSLRRFAPQDSPGVEFVD